MKPPELIASLVEWVGNDSARYAQLVDSRDATVQALIESKGSQIITATTGGNSFSMAPNGYTFGEWLLIVRAALKAIDTGRRGPVTKTIGLI